MKISVQSFSMSEETGGGEEEEEESGNELRLQEMKEVKEE